MRFFFQNISAAIQRTDCVYEIVRTSNNAGAGEGKAIFKTLANCYCAEIDKSMCCLSRNTNTQSHTHTDLNTQIQVRTKKTKTARASCQDLDSPTPKKIEKKLIKNKQNTVSGYLHIGIKL